MCPFACFIVTSSSDMGLRMQNFGVAIGLQRALMDQWPFGTERYDGAHTNRVQARHSLCESQCENRVVALEKSNVTVNLLDNITAKLQFAMQKVELVALPLSAQSFESHVFVGVFLPFSQCRASAEVNCLVIRHTHNLCDNCLASVKRPKHE